MNDVLLACATPRIGQLVLVEFPGCEVSSFPIALNGYVAEVEEIGRELFAVVNDDTEVNSTVSGLYLIGRSVGPKKLLKESGATGRVRGITSSNGRLFVLVEDEILTLDASGRFLVPIGRASPSYQCRSFEGNGDVVSYIHSNGLLALFDTTSGQTTLHRPVPQEEYSVCPFGIVGSTVEGFLIRTPDGSYSVFDCDSGRASPWRLDLLELERLGAIRTRRTSIGYIVWGGGDHNDHDPSSQILSLATGQTSIVRGVEILDVVEVPAGFGRVP